VAYDDIDGITMRFPLREWGMDDPAVLADACGTQHHRATPHRLRPLLSPAIVGHYWLDQRRDGRAIGIWQIASYSGKSRSVVYRSTKQRDLSAAGDVLRAFEAAQRSKAPQEADQAELLPHLFNYLREQGPDVKRLDTIKSSFRAWIGFLMQDELGTGARVADVSKNFAARFRRWRMGPHEWEIEWGGKVFSHKSPGVTAKTVQRNVEDLRAALHHAEANHRITAPKVQSVDKKLIKRNPRQTLEIEMLGAIFGYAKTVERGQLTARSELCRELMLAGSGCRPGHAMKFDPASESNGSTTSWTFSLGARTDGQAGGGPARDRPAAPVLADWKANPHDPVGAARRPGGRCGASSGLPSWVEAYCIRTTVATYLDAEGTPGGQISGIIGHLPESRGISRTTSKHYLAYDPRNCRSGERGFNSTIYARHGRSRQMVCGPLTDHSRQGTPNDH
jgi:hypothetical protein